MDVAQTPGITVDGDGRRVLDKEYRGVRIYARLGRVNQAAAERRLETEIQRVESQIARRSNCPPRFADAAARYLEQSRDKRSIDVTAWHVRLLIPYIGTLELDRIHDATLERFIADRRTQGVAATTINRSLEIVRTVLNRAARSYRDDEGHRWLRACRHYHSESARQIVSNNPGLTRTQKCRGFLRYRNFEQKPFRVSS